MGEKEWEGNRQKGDGIVRNGGCPNSWKGKLVSFTNLCEQEKAFT